jgi:hypothetical protein
MTMNHPAIGAYPAVGCGPYGFSPYGSQPAFAPPYANPAALAGPQQWSIVGADAPPAPAPAPAGQTFTDKAKAFLGNQTFGVKNGYLLAGATVVGLGAWGWHAGWFGKKGKRR